MALREPAYKSSSFAAKGAGGRDSEDDKSGARWKGSAVRDFVVKSPAVVFGSAVAREAGLVGVVGLQLRGAANVKRLDVEKERAARTVRAAHNEVGPVVEGRPWTSVPLVQRLTLSRQVREDTVGAKDRFENGGEDGEHGVVRGGVEADAERAGVKVAVVGE